MCMPRITVSEWISATELAIVQHYKFFFMGQALPSAIILCSLACHRAVDSRICRFLGALVGRACHRMLSTPSPSLASPYPLATNGGSSAASRFVPHKFKYNGRVALALLPSLATCAAYGGNAVAAALAVRTAATAETADVHTRKQCTPLQASGTVGHARLPGPPRAVAAPSVALPPHPTPHPCRRRSCHQKIWGY